LWEASDSVKRCFYLDVVPSGENPRGIAGCSKQNAEEPSISNIDSFLVGRAPEPHTRYASIPQLDDHSLASVNSGFFLLPAAPHLRGLTFHVDLFDLNRRRISTVDLTVH
jgi:hypothetical protein